MHVRTVNFDPDHVMHETKSEHVVQELQLAPVSSEPLVFTKVDRFTTFLAEYTFRGRDIVLHFFPSEEVHKSSRARQYWLEVFPRVLDPVARSFFGAEPPRLEAQYIEVAIPSFAPADAAASPSWWFCAHGFIDILDIEGFVERFFSVLDHALDAENAM